MLKKIMCALVLMTAPFNYGKNKKKKIWLGWHSLILPGMNACGGEPYRKCKEAEEYQKFRPWAKIMNISNTETYHRYPTLLNPDIGQENCIQCFFSELVSFDRIARAGKNIFFGISQGTATGINALGSGKYTHADQDEFIKCLFLESILASTSSAIMHVIENLYFKPLGYLPFVRCWSPWVAKIFLPGYDPRGIQAINSAKNLSPNFPKILTHHVLDLNLSINDARRMYCVLMKNNPKNNVYLIEVTNHVDNVNHLNILLNSPDLLQALQAIYKKEGLPYYDDDSCDLSKINLTPYQPTIEEVEKRIYQSSWKSRWLRNAIDVAAIVAIAEFIKRKCIKKGKRGNLYRKIINASTAVTAGAYLYWMRNSWN